MEHFLLSGIRCPQCDCAQANVFRPGACLTLYNFWNGMRELRYAVRRMLWHGRPSHFSVRRDRATRQYSVALYAGPSPFELAPAPGVGAPLISWQHVTDAPAHSAADPFMVRVDARWYLFFEIVSLLSRRGEIACASSADGIDWQYHGVVLHEPFHLSYPQVFEWRGELYMIPETGRARAVRLYRALRFPFRWRHVATLLTGGRFVDSSVLFHDHAWWMLTDAGPRMQEPVLRLFHARALHGPWREHPASPVVEGDPVTARPAGRVIVHDGTPVRFAQPVAPLYGTQVRAFRIHELTPTRYRETPVSDEPLLGPGSDAWNAHGMHHIDAHRRDDGSWWACVDGFRLRRPAAPHPGLLAGSEPEMFERQPVHD